MSLDRRIAGPHDPRHALGRRGEQLAAAHLRRLGISLLGRNVRTIVGEIDLIALDRRGSPNRHALVFVEVKARRLRTGQAEPREDQIPLGGLRPRQRAHLRGLAVAWLADRRRTRPSAATIRFDAVGVLIDGRGRPRRIEHIEDAW